MLNIHITYLRNSKKLYGELRLATALSAGFDLRACLETEFIEIAPNHRVGINTGVALDISKGIIDLPSLNLPLAGFVYSRSGLGAVKGLTVAQGVGLIDPDYRGEIKVFLLNTSQENQRIEHGERIAQLVFQPYCPVNLIEVQELDESQRGIGGFGASGRL